MEDTNKLNNLMDTAMQNVKKLVDVNTVVGEPIFTPDGTTLIPISRVSLGFGGAGADFAQNKGYGGGTGCGVRVEPLGFIVVKDGSVRMMNVIPPANNTLDRLIDLVPTVADRVDEMIDKIKEDKAEK